jgi:hypothetical protein
MMYIGGPLDGQAADDSGPTYAHKRVIGRGEIHRKGVKLEPGDRTHYDASVTDFYRRCDLVHAIHYVHLSLTDEQARKNLR